MQTLHLAPLILETLCIIDCHRNVAGKSLQDFDLCAGEGIYIMVRCPEDTDDLVAHSQGNDDLRAGMRFAGAVEQLLRHIGGIVRLPGGNDLGGQALCDRPAFTLVRLGAAVYGGQMEFIAVNQQNAGFDATKIHRNAVNDRVEEFVEFEDGGDLLRRLLQGQQYVHAALLEDCRGRGKGKRSGGAGHEVGLLRAV